METDRVECLRRPVGDPAFVRDICHHGHSCYANRDIFRDSHYQSSLTALYYGGPGAIFWMWVTAFFGTALKFAESTLGHKYREILPDGTTAGGPMYTIEKGLGPNWRWMAVAFASFAVICSFATGNAIQSFTVSDQIYSEITQLFGSTSYFTLKHEIFTGFEVSLAQVVNGLVLSAIVGAVSGVPGKQIKTILLE